MVVKEGTSLPKSQSKGQKNLPKEIVMTNLRPDIVLSSQKAKTVVMIELIVPWEDHIEEANERKILKYDELILENCVLARDGQQYAYQWWLVLEVFPLSRSITCYQCLV